LGLFCLSHAKLAMLITEKIQSPAYGL
jgi:hypothetical protein